MKKILVDSLTMRMFIDSLTGLFFPHCVTSNAEETMREIEWADVLIVDCREPFDRHRDTLSSSDGFLIGYAAAKGKRIVLYGPPMARLPSWILKVTTTLNDGDQLYRFINT